MTVNFERRGVTVARDRDMKTHCYGSGAAMYLSSTACLTLGRLVGEADLGPVKSAFIHIGLEQEPFSFIYCPRPPFDQAVNPTYSLRKTQPFHCVYFGPCP